MASFYYYVIAAAIVVTMGIVALYTEDVLGIVVIGSLSILPLLYEPKPDFTNTVSVMVLLGVILAMVLGSVNAALISDYNTIILKMMICACAVPSIALHLRPSLSYIGGIKSLLK